MLRGIDAVLTAGEHGDGAGGEARAVGGRVDPAGKAGNDAKAGLAKIAR
jgi:hypothetical protein